MKVAKTRILTLVVSVLLLTTLMTGIASALPSIDQYYSFDLPEGGETQKGTAILKTDEGDALFDISRIANSSGLSCYVNVRSSDGNTIVGYAAAVAGIGKHYVSYKPSYGTVGTRYRPSAQTDNDSTVSAYLEGYWIA